MEDARKSVAGELDPDADRAGLKGRRDDLQDYRGSPLGDERGTLAVVLHLEGAEAIDGDLHFLEVLYAAGLRSLGPVWSRNNIFGHGVPFHFPASPDLGDGLTPPAKGSFAPATR